MVLVIDFQRHTCRLCCTLKSIDSIFRVSWFVLQTLLQMHWRSSWKISSCGIVTKGIRKSTIFARVCCRFFLVQIYNCWFRSRKVLQFVIWWWLDVDSFIFPDTLQTLWQWELHAIEKFSTNYSQSIFRTTLEQLDKIVKGCILNVCNFYSNSAINSKLQAYLICLYNRY